MPADPTLVSGLSGRYALALYELGEEAQSLDRLEADLKAVRAMTGESADLRRLMTSPLLSRSDQEQALTALARKAELSDLAVNFLGTVARNRRLNVLDRIIDAFFTLLAAGRGQITARVTSAQALSDPQRDKLKSVLQGALKRDISLDEAVAPELIGGLVVRIGSRQIDASLKTKLDQIEQAMKGI